MKTLLHFFLLLIAFWVSIIIPPVHSQCIKDQQLSLLQFKKSLVFNATFYSFFSPFLDPSFNLSSKLISWNASTDCCSWVGVTCSRSGRVLGLDISSEHISAGIDNSSSLFHLHYLESLNLADNELGSEFQSIPSAIGKLVNLRYLNLSLNHYSGKIPIEISRLRKLVVLDLSDKYDLLKLGSPNLHMLVQNFTELRELYLDGVLISEQGSEWCRAISSSLPNLRVLSMSSCNLSGPLLESLAKLQSLSVIRLDRNNISGPVPGFFATFSNLTALSLRSCRLNGTFPKEIFQLPSLQSIDLSYNQQLDGSLPEFPRNGSLQYLHLKRTKFSGLLPNSIGNLKLLSSINIQYCNFTGPIPSFSGAKNVGNIDLSYNGLTGTINSTYWRNLTKLSSLILRSNKLDENIPASLFSLPLLENLDLSSNQFSGSFPEISNVSSYLLNGPDLELDLRNQSNLSHLELSENQISGKIPDWIWSLSNLYLLNLSCNSLDSLEVHSINLTNLYYLDLHSNQFHGQIPIFPSPCSVYHLDLSRNYFSSIIPSTIGDVFLNTTFFSLSSNNLSGIIPESLCNSEFLHILDLSNNSLSGTVPQCLTTMPWLIVLNVRRNNLTNVDDISHNCQLTTLDISENHLQGRFLKSLVNCTKLEVLNLGNNLITEPFPCFLRNLATLSVLVLRSNKFYGDIGCRETNGTWPVLQIIDLAHNNFSGEIPGTALTTWQAMRTSKDDAPWKNGQLRYKMGGAYYQEDTIIVTNKGLDMELLVVLNIFISIDFSCNKFNGSIPEEIGDLESLYALNLSNNAFKGAVPSSLSNLGQLESLDLSKNKLSGHIPPELTKLTFLAFLNLSYNQLVGRIPSGNQFSTFDAASFQGNKGLWGPPLTAANNTGFPSPKLEGNHSNPGHEIDWNIICPEIGFTCGFGIAIGSLLFCKRWRKWFYRAMYNMLLKIFPQLEQRFGHHRRHVYVHQRYWRR